MVALSFLAGGAGFWWTFSLAGGVVSLVTAVVSLVTACVGGGEGLVMGWEGGAGGFGLPVEENWIGLEDKACLERPFVTAPLSTMSRNSSPEFFTSNCASTCFKLVHSCPFMEMKTSPLCRSPACALEPGVT